MPRLTTTEAARLVVLRGYVTNYLQGGPTLNESELNELKSLSGRSIDQNYKVDWAWGTAGSFY